MYPILFSIYKITVHSYYVLWTVALVTAFLWTQKRAVNQYGVESSKMHVLLFVVAIGIVIGACVGMIVHVGPTVIRNDSLRVFRFWEGGMSSFYSFFGGSFFALAYIFFFKLSLWRVAESASLPSAALIAIGRWGCFMNGCCAGIETTLPWGTRFPIDPQQLTRHPTQLYYSFGALLILIMLQEVEKRIGRGERKLRVALLWPLFLILFGLLRILVDPLRIDWLLLGEEASHRGSLIMILVGSIWLVISYINFRRLSD
ncbi:prolipoprotein diacylglyceryl transferase [Aminobacterium sp. MB27-C1]|uniref:prolipoprotein diacylglyceryl transferase n=1 Tax=Aminobacterium sp. MB27-C1 TaxID=3070661 RepID=UPI001BCB2294|nr:prolipoprotein diacylglyceryl transferase [Aminobacterium sp. MB27-C1]WMI70553.1 prolipoprotein diacylglyceryl transferase [Aminobacterium sp. MB27-C1]